MGREKIMEVKRLGEILELQTVHVYFLICQSEKFKG